MHYSRNCGILLANTSMMLLERSDFYVPLTVRSDSLSSSGRSGHCGDIRNSIFDRSLANIGIIMLACFASRCIDDQLDIPIDNSIHDVWLALMQF